MKKQRLLELAGVVTENEGSVQEELIDAIHTRLSTIGAHAAAHAKIEGDLESAFDMAAGEAITIVRKILSKHGIS